MTPCYGDPPERPGHERGEPPGLPHEDANTQAGSMSFAYDPEAAWSRGEGSMATAPLPAGQSLGMTTTSESGLDVVLGALTNWLEANWGPALPLRVSGERVFVTMYGVALLGIRVLLYALAIYVRREHLHAPGSVDESDIVRRSILPVVGVYGTAILTGLVLPAVAVGLYCAIAVFLVVPFGELRRLLFRRA
jgi:hypothetical protein